VASLLLSDVNPPSRARAIGAESFASHLAKIPFNPLLTVFEGFLRYEAGPADRDEKDRSTKQKSHSADCQPHSYSTHVKNPKRNDLA